MQTTFKVSQKVVYPTHGVGVVTEIQEREFNGKPTLYYEIYIEGNDMTVLIPVENAEERGIRAIVPTTKAESALELLKGDMDAIPSDWKMRYEVNRQHLIRGDVTDIAKVVQTLYHRSKLKDLPVLERKLYDSAIKILIEELSISLKQDPHDIEELIFANLDSADVIIQTETGG